MSQKAEKPTLSGTRLKTRKRDEKEKYDPHSFRDAIIQGLNETGGDLEKVTKFLDVAGSRLNYRRYAEVLFDVLFAGGILAPGGFIVEEGDTTKPSRTDVCVFKCDEATHDKIKGFYEVFYKLIRRYKYLEKAFEEEVRKVLVFQKGFTDDERKKLGIITGQLLACGLCSARVLTALFEEHLVKEGISLDSAAEIFEEWLSLKDVREVFSALKKMQVDTRLQELLPLNKRNKETYCTYFREKGLGAIADMQMSSQASKAKKEAQELLSEMITNESPVADMLEFCQDLIQKQGMSETEVTITIWNTVMMAVEWNKKEDLVAEQAMKHLRVYTPLLADSAKSAKAELSLMLRVQEFCYENMNFLKSFQKIIIMLYKTDVLSEDTIVRWYKQAHSPKGKSVFLDQMKSFVEWLEKAEEESDEEEEA
ncbi:eIF5-mimic protein 2-like [Littorina saxatilis]|uniref:W2 domain-containing protein n=1 Tax=Littorina saxatilis TaxID=31220 RepID=A0AAN9G264_9CAEN